MSEKKEIQAEYRNLVDQLGGVAQAARKLGLTWQSLNYRINQETAKREHVFALKYILGGSDMPENKTKLEYMKREKELVLRINELEGMLNG